MTGFYYNTGGRFGNELLPEYDDHLKFFSASPINTSLAKGHLKCPLSR